MVMEKAATVTTGHVFISFASEDVKLAERVLEGLEAAGLRCWIAHRDIQPAENYPAAITAAVKSCSALVLVLTTESLGSRHVLREIEMAFNAERPVLTIRLGGVALSPNLEYFLSTTQWLDAGAELDEDDLDRVRMRLRELLSRTAGTTAAAEGSAGAAPAAQAPPRVYVSRRFWVPVLSFHVISILMASTDLVDYLAPASYGMAVGTGVAVVALTAHCNVPVLFTVGFMQPILIYLPDAMTAPPEVLRALPVGLPLWIGAACAGGGWLMSLRYGRPTGAAFSVAEWRAWMAPTWILLGRSEKLEAVLKVLVVIIAVVGWLFRLF
jgi:hypothetical protein